VDVLEGLVMRRTVIAAGAAAIGAGVALVAARSRVLPGESWRQRLFFVTMGLPSGPLGWLGAREMTLEHRPMYATMAKELDLRPDDDLLEVGCGSAGLLKDHAAHVRYIAGLDASEIQVAMARRRLAERIAAGTAEIVMGDAAALPWEDGRFSVVTSFALIEFVPDPLKALSEMHRVLRPGGRAVLSLGTRVGVGSESGTKSPLGLPRWSEADARRLMEEAGFGDVSVSPPPTAYFSFQLGRGMKQASVVPEPVAVAHA
jgi:SAM-dependent methyltransferase